MDPQLAILCPALLRWSSYVSDYNVALLFLLTEWREPRDSCSAPDSYACWVQSVGSMIKRSIDMNMTVESRQGVRHINPCSLGRNNVSIASVPLLHIYLARLGTYLK